MDKNHRQFVEKYRRQRQKMKDLLEYVDAEKDLLFEKDPETLSV